MEEETMKTEEQSSAPQGAEGKSLCEKCDYCDDGTVYKRCLGCKKCFCEMHAGAEGYCSSCK